MWLWKVAGTAALIILPGFVQALGLSPSVRPHYRTEITPLQNGEFLVKAIGSSAPVNYWCGIGDFVLLRLGLPSSQRIYISKAYEPGVRTVQFSLTPPPGADTKPGYSVTVKRVGANMSAASAVRYCDDNFMEFDF